MKRSISPLESILIALGVVFLLLPTLLVIPLSLSGGDFLLFPPEGVSLRWYGNILSDPRWTGALGRSAVLSSCGATAATITGLSAAWYLESRQGATAAATRIAAMSPIVMPPIVLAIGAFIAFTRIGIYGSPVGVVLAYTVLGTPFAVALGSVAIRRLDHNLELAARGLGARQFQVLIHVTIPQLMPTIVGSWMLAFLVAFDEVVITSFVLPRGLGNTVAIELYSELRNALTPLVAAMSGLLILAAVTLTLLGGWRFAGIENRDRKSRREPKGAPLGDAMDRAGSGASTRGS